MLQLSMIQKLRALLDWYWLLILSLGYEEVLTLPAAPEVPRQQHTQVRSSLYQHYKTVFDTQVPQPEIWPIILLLLCVVIAFGSRVWQKRGHYKMRSDSENVSLLYCDSLFYDSSTDSEESDFISLYDDLKYNVLEDPFEVYKRDLIDLYIH